MGKRKICADGSIKGLIGKIEGGKLVLEKTKLDKRLKGRNESYIKWVYDCIDGFAAREFHNEDYFFIVLQGGRIWLKLDMEKYAHPGGGFCIPSRLMIGGR